MNPPMGDPVKDILDLTIVIVNYNAGELIRECLASIYGSGTRCSFRIHVLDNCSSDGSPERLLKEFPEITLTRNRQNVGFGRANNQVLRSVKDTRYFLALNPDIVVTPGSIDFMGTYMDDHPDVGICGCKLLNPDLTLQNSCRTWPNPLTILLRGLQVEKLVPDGRLFLDYYMRDWDHKDIAEVDWVLGSCMMIRREIFTKVEPFDEKFFMYYEDVDLAMRCWQAGWKVVYIPEVHMIHHHKQESHSWKSPRVLFQHIKSAFHFFHKHKFFQSVLMGSPRIERRVKIS
jgi:GT2 family glycosyltransferase